MAGDGSRFKGHGLGDYKPLIKIDNTTLVERTINSFDPNKISSLTFGIRIEHEKKFKVTKQLKKIWPTCNVVTMPRTKGNLETCLKTLLHAKIPPEESVVFVDCDNPFDKTNILDICFENGCSICLLGFIDHERSNKWCYVSHNNNLVTGVYEKNIASAGCDAIALIGFFAFKYARCFEEIAKYVLQENTGVKGEFYTSQSIKESLCRGEKIAVLIADGFVPMGTAEDVKKIL